MWIRRKVIVVVLFAAALLLSIAVRTASAAPPPNVLFANATVISSLPFSQTLYTTQSTSILPIA